MDDRVTLDGKKYISSKRAAQLGGYTKDYIGQMCRSGKLDAKLLGRNWYVHEDSLMKHKGNKKTGKNSLDTSNISYTKEESSYKVTVDDRPLNPTPTKTTKVSKKPQKQYKVVTKKPERKRSMPIFRLITIVILLAVIASTILTEGKIAYNSETNSLFAGIQLAEFEKLIEDLKMLFSR